MGFRSVAATEVTSPDELMTILSHTRRSELVNTRSDNLKGTATGIARRMKRWNELIFDQLYAKKESIEAAFDCTLTWERLNDRRACRIKCEMPGKHI